MPFMQRHSLSLVTEMHIKNTNWKYNVFGIAVFLPGWQKKKKKKV